MPCLWQGPPDGEGVHLAAAPPSGAGDARPRRSGRTVTANMLRAPWTIRIAQNCGRFVHRIAVEAYLGPGPRDSEHASM